MCTFTLGFATLRAMVGALTVGNCLENERHNPANGNAEQRTTRGLLAWRKADNWTAFTDGYRTWINGPFGLQTRLNTERFVWESDAAPVPPAAPPRPVAPPAPPPPAAFPVWLFVPAGQLGPGYYDVETAEPAPGLFAYTADSPLGPLIIQTLSDEGTPGLALIAMGVWLDESLLNPASRLNAQAGAGPVFEIPSPGPPGSRAFKRSADFGAHRQIEVVATKGRYFAHVLITYPAALDGQPGHTAARAAQVLQLLLARLPG